MTTNNPKASCASAFEAKLNNPSNQRRLRSMIPAAPDIQLAVLQFVLCSSLTKKAGIETIQKELKSRKVDLKLQRKSLG